MTVIEIIRMIGKEFDDIDDEDLENWIELAKPWVSKKQFDNLYDQALALMVCHRMKIAGEGVDPLGSETTGGAGYIAFGLAVGSVSEGGSSISFGSSQSGLTGSDAELATTIYGVQFLQLRRSVVIPIICGDMR